MSKNLDWKTPEEYEPRNITWASLGAHFRDVLAKRDPEFYHYSNKDRLLNEVRFYGDLTMIELAAKLKRPVQDIVADLIELRKAAERLITHPSSAVLVKDLAPSGGWQMVYKKYRFIKDKEGFAMRHHIEPFDIRILIKIKDFDARAVFNVARELEVSIDELIERLEKMANIEELKPSWWERSGL